MYPFQQNKTNTINNVYKSVDSINQFISPINTGFANDSCISSDTDQSVKPGRYRMTERTTFKPDCYMDHQIMSGNGLPVAGIVDLESELRGNNHINSKCDSQTLKRKNVFNMKSVNNLNNCIPNQQLTAVDTRIKKACKSESRINRFGFPLEKYPITSNNYIGMNTRLNAKRKTEKENLDYSKTYF